MRTRLWIAAALILTLGLPGVAHRLNEYLQSTLISVEKNRVTLSMRLIPGLAVSSSVIAHIDRNRDGVITEDERQAYARTVLHDLSLSVDGQLLNPRLTSVSFPTNNEMKEGLGEIQLEFTADLPPGRVNRRFVFINHHQSAIAAYLVNCLVPRDKDIHVVSQVRNQVQSVYQLDYVQAGEPPNVHGDLFASAQFRFRGFLGMFRLGMHHIAEGTDHLLFLLTLLLPAPLLARSFRWSEPVSPRAGLLQILKVVTAFTFGHSISLVLAGLGVVHVPSRAVEVFIAISILVSAVHALRPLFPGREAPIAASFGLVHGLAFASTLGQLGLNGWERTLSILGFNLGIEAMQILVVAATLPSLMLLSRTPAHAAVRIGAALLAGAASLGWIVERLFDVHTCVDAIVSSVAHEACWLAVALFMFALFSWCIRNSPDRKNIVPGQLIDVGAE